MDNKKKTGTVRVWRRIIQVISFLALPGLFTSIFYAMKDIYSAILTGTFSLSAMFPQLTLFTGSMIITILTGRFFCGFLCSFGAMGDFLWFLSKKTGNKGLKVNEKADAWLKNLKYVILAFIILGIWTFSLGNIGKMIGPWAVFGMYSKIGSWPSFKYLLTIGGFLLLLIIIGSLLIERFFCRYLCPLGAVFAVVSRFRLFRIKKERSKCGSCRLCTNKCSMGIPLYQYDTVTSGECIDCFECTSACPRHNVRANGAPVVVSTVSAAAMFGLVYAGNIQAQMVSSQDQMVSSQALVESSQAPVESSQAPAESSQAPAENSQAPVANSKAPVVSSQAPAVSSQAPVESSPVPVESSQAPVVSNQTPATVEAQSNTGKYVDGTYTGTGQGFRGETKTSVTVKNGNITDITVLSYEDDKSYFKRAVGKVTSEIVNSQSAEVDAVSGATFSSDGIMESVANALNVSNAR